MSMAQISLGGLANFNSAVPWGLWVAIYVWLVGISASSFLLAMWGNLKNNQTLKSITRMAINLSLATLMAGLFSILIDLGRIERFYKLIVSPSPASVMAWMVWLYGVFFVILVMALFKSKEIKGLFLTLALLFSLAVIVIESLLFAAPPGRDWHSLLFILKFLTSALASGIAALVFTAGIFCPRDRKRESLKGLTKLALFLIILNFAVEAAEMFYLGSINLSLVLLNAIAIILLAMKNPVIKTSGGAAALATILVSKYKALISGQLSEPYRGFQAAYVEPRLAFSYVPSAFEFFVSLALVLMTAVLFYILYKIFPLTREA